MSRRKVKRELIATLLELERRVTELDEATLSALIVVISGVMILAGTSDLVPICLNIRRRCDARRAYERN